MMSEARTGTVSRTNSVRMLGFSRSLGLNCVVIQIASPPPASYSKRESGVQRRSPEMPVGRLLVGVAGGEDGRLGEGAADDLEADRHAVRCHAARQGEGG